MRVLKTDYKSEGYKHRNHRSRKNQKSYYDKPFSIKRKKRLEELKYLYVQEED